MTEEQFISKEFTARGSFTSGIEGPAVDRDGNIYAVNYERQGTIGKVTPEGKGEVFVELPEGSVASGIRFNQEGTMLIADYAAHHILKVDMETKKVDVFIHEPTMNQPNDIAITDEGVLFASDPNWKASTGKLWRIDTDGTVTLLEDGMGTTNGIEVSPDGKRLYVNETEQRNVWVYDLAEDNSIHNKRLLIQFPDYGLDGMRCDVAGNLYVTRFGKGTVVKLSAEGEVIREIRLHGAKCTNLTFGGPDGRTCYVTEAEKGNLERFRVDLPGRCWNMYRDRVDTE